MSYQDFIRPIARRAVHRAIALAAGAAGLLTTIARRRVDAPPAAGTHFILVIRIDLLGDVLFTEPLVRGLRDTYPEASITWVTLPYTAPLARSYGLADRVIELDSNRIRSPRGLLDPRTWRTTLAAIRAIRAERPDLAISVAGRTASLVALLSGARRRIGYLDEAYRWTLTDGIPEGRYHDRQHEVEYVRALARRAGVRDAPAGLHAPVDVEDCQSITHALAERGVPDSARVVLVHAGALNGSAKRWPPAYWAAFADRVHDETGASIVLAGARGDAPLADEVCGRASMPIVSMVGATTIGQLIALIDRADLVATGDSGPLHLAVARGRPLVAVYGPTDPLVHGPYHPSAPVRVHRVDLPCSPCYTLDGMADCPLGDPTCMRLVPVSAVVASTVELLQAESPPSSDVPLRTSNA
jgi:lipopolysaccharide heptosyltransferase II